IGTSRQATPMLMNAERVHLRTGAIRDVSGPGWSRGEHVSSGRSWSKCSEYFRRTRRAAHLKENRARPLFRTEPEPEKAATNPFLPDDGRQLGHDPGAMGKAEAQAVRDGFDPLCLLEQGEQFLAALAELTGR